VKETIDRQQEIDPRGEEIFLKIKNKELEKYRCIVPLCLKKPFDFGRIISLS